MRFLLFSFVLFSANTVSQVSQSYGSGSSKIANDKMSEIQYAYYWQRNKNNQDDLLQKGKINPFKGSQPLYRFPLQSNLPDNGFYGISNYVDLDPTYSNPPSTILDYNCGSRSYDTTSGYNHQGIDIFTWPFAWDKMDHNAVTVNAAAAGVITDKIDGNPDRSCSFNVTTNWNYIAVTHADGSYVWYGHMKSGSLTSKNVGDSVVAGEYLGVVGSSGISTGPHLHLETYNSSNQLIEPFAGSCNNLNVNSWWLVQENYYESEMTKIATHSQAPNPFPVCSSNPTDTPYYQDFFTTPATVYLTRYYRDQLSNQNTHITIYQPNGQIYNQWDHMPTGFNHYTVAYWYNILSIPSGNSAYSGEWIFQTDYQGVITQHKFYVDYDDVIFTNGFE